jgi:hypothetical protein
MKKRKKQTKFRGKKFIIKGGIATKLSLFIASPARPDKQAH